MLRFAANISMLFGELPMLSRVSAASLAGFKAIEMMFPYAHDAGDLREHLDAHDMSIVLFNAPPGDWEAGERGLAAIPGRKADFETSISTALDHAAMLDCARIHVMAGRPSPTLDPDHVMDTFLDNLGHAANEAARRGVTLLIEPINTRDVPGYFLTTTEQARRVIEAVGADNLKLQLDLYHRQVMQGDLATTIRANSDITGHIQIANPPERTEPSRGEINYDHVFDVILETGYRGWIGCEYRPSGATRESLGWLGGLRHVHG